MQSRASGIKFCGARARVVCVILVHEASRVMSHGYFESTSTKQTEQSFAEAKDSSLGRFLFMIDTPCCKYRKNDV